MILIVELRQLDMVVEIGYTTSKIINSLDVKEFAVGIFIPKPFWDHGKTTRIWCSFFGPDF